MSKERGRGGVYLLPTLLGESAVDDVIPIGVQVIAKHCKYFIVENIRSARRYLKKIDRAINIDELTFFELNKHTNANDLQHFLDPVLNGNDIAIVSEAGCPAIADPGSVIVGLAHELKIEVIPLVGPSSILMALMGSGFNGQAFTFHGYLPKNTSERKKSIKHMEMNVTRSSGRGGTQVFIETPFRNQLVLDELIATCREGTLLCIATDISLPSQRIVTKTMKQWSASIPKLHKRLCVFAIGSS